MRRSCFGQIMSVAGLAVLFLLPIASTRAQRITVDGRLSPAQTLIGPNYAIGANLGRQVGSNLFHSFGAFGLNRNETATFSGPPSVANVIGRVTGGAQSSIDGTVRSTMPGANVYLINPAGVVFGPNAQVNVSGSFHASSADYLRLQDGARFQATNPDASTLTAAPPAAFGFLTPNPGPVTVSRATLGAAKGGTLGLVGGPVTISGGVLQAPAGTVHITSAAGPGEVAVNPRSAPASTVSSFGPVRVEGKSKIAVSDAAGLGSGGSVFIRAGALAVAASEIDADNHGAGPGGMVSLRGDGAVTISDGANVHAYALGAGRGADISIGAGSDLLVDTSNISADTYVTGRGGDANVMAAGNLTIRHGNISANTFGMGQGGKVMVQADSIIQDAGYISANTSGTGQGGSVGVMATGGLTILNAGNISSTTSGAGSGGQVAVRAGDLTISLGGQISAATYSSGAGANVFVTVPGAMVIDGSGATTGSKTGISSQAAEGNAGQLTVQAGNLTVRNRGAISADTSGTGPGGNVDVTATGSLSILNGGAISANTSGTGQGGKMTVQANSIMQDAGYISAFTSGAGQGGNVDVTATGNLTILNGGAISANTYGTGQGGMVTVRADSIMQDAGYISANTQGMGQVGNVDVTTTGNLTIRNGGNISSITSGAGSGGQVAVRAGDLTISLGGQITAGTYSSGKAGDVSVRVPGTMVIDGSEATGLTGIGSQAQPGSTGNAGSMAVSAGSLTIRNGGAISSNTFGPGGKMTVQADSIMLQDAGYISANTQGTGQGGAVGVTATGSLTILNGGNISADTYGTGQGGMVTVRADSIMQDAGYISANTQGMGQGGNVDVTTTGNLTIRNGGNISGTTSGAGSGGTLVVQAKNLDISRGGQISAGTYSSGDAGGDAGSVFVTVPGAIDIDGSGATPGSETGIASRAFPASTGKAGSVTVSAGSLAIHGGIGSSSGISTDTRGTGDAGTLDVTVMGGALTIDGAGTETGIGSRALLPGGPGKAGTIQVKAGNLAIGGSLSGISTSTSGTGNGGTITVTAGSDIRLMGSGPPQITAASTGTGDDAGNAGSITISAPRLISLRDGASISTAAAAGRGGDITISAPRLILRDGASISTAAATSPSRRRGSSACAMGRASRPRRRRAAAATSPSARATCSISRGAPPSPPLPKVQLAAKLASPACGSSSSTAAISQHRLAPKPTSIFRLPSSCSRPTARSAPLAASSLSTHR